MRLHFVKTSIRSYDILNKADIFMGEIRKRRVGGYMNWCFLPVPTLKLGDLWFTNTHLKEIVIVIGKLYNGEVI